MALRTDYWNVSRAAVALKTDYWNIVVPLMVSLRTDYWNLNVFSISLKTDSWASAHLLSNVLTDYWKATFATYDAVLKRWDGSWVKAKLNIYTGGSFVNKPLGVWDGSDWLDIDNTG